MRLFIAIELESRIREGILALREHVRDVDTKVRWIKPDSIHMTIKFLGQVEDKRLFDIKNALRKSAACCEPFELTVSGYGCFPKKGPVKILWAGAESPADCLIKYAEACENAFEEIGFQREKRSFSPHITIGRVKWNDSKGGLRSAVEESARKVFTQQVSALTLFESVLKPSGAEYLVVAREEF